MDSLTTSAASGLRARLQTLDMLANNLANSATDGFKADREFYGLYSGESDDPSFSVPMIDKPWIDFAQGVLRPTGKSTDLAMTGKGMFAVNGPAGELFTRNGSLHVSATGMVSSSEGYTLRLTTGEPLQVQPLKPFDVAEDGTVEQDGQPLGKLEIVDYTKMKGLARFGNGYFQAADAKTAPPQAAGVEVHQGQLEGSNSGAAEGAVRLVQVMRQFETLHKAITLHAEMGRKAIDEVARVGS